MNTLTIAVLLVCATMAYASAVPGKGPVPHVETAAEPAEIFEGAESRGYGGGGHHHGGGGHHHGGGGHHHGGGGHHYGGGHGHYGK